MLALVIVPKLNPSGHICSQCVMVYRKCCSLYRSRFSFAFYVSFDRKWLYEDQIFWKWECLDYHLCRQ